MVVTHPAGIGNFRRTKLKKKKKKEVQESLSGSQLRNHWSSFLSSNKYKFNFKPEFKSPRIHWRVRHFVTLQQTCVHCLLHWTHVLTHQQSQPHWCKTNPEVTQVLNSHQVQWDTPTLKIQIYREHYATIPALKSVSLLSHTSISTEHCYLFCLLSFFMAARILLIQFI